MSYICVYTHSTRQRKLSGTEERTCKNQAVWEGQQRDKSIQMYAETFKKRYDAPPWPILASTRSSSGLKMRGTPFKIVMTDV